MKLKSSIIFLSVAAFTGTFFAISQIRASALRPPIKTMEMTGLTLQGDQWWACTNVRFTPPNQILDGVGPKAFIREGRFEFDFGPTPQNPNKDRMHVNVVYGNVCLEKFAISVATGVACATCPAVANNSITGYRGSIPLTITKTYPDKRTETTKVQGPLYTNDGVNYYFGMSIRVRSTLGALTYVGFKLVQGADSQISYTCAY